MNACLGENALKTKTLMSSLLNKEVSDAFCVGPYVYYKVGPDWFKDDLSCKDKARKVIPPVCEPVDLNCLPVYMCLAIIHDAAVTACRSGKPQILSDEILKGAKIEPRREALQKLSVYFVED